MYAYAFAPLFVMCTLQIRALYLTSNMIRDLYIYIYINVSISTYKEMQRLAIIAYGQASLFFGLVHKKYQ